MDDLNDYTGPTGQTPPILPMTGLHAATPVIPKLYWDSYDDEQRIKLLWKCFGEIADLVNQLSYYYIPTFGGDWSATVQYPPLTVVSAPAGIEGVTEGDSYTALKYVPIGTSLTNTEYWAKTGNYNAQVEEARQMAEDAKNSASEAQASADQKAPIEHASGTDEYGVGSDSLYGHVMLTDTPGSSGVSNGVAATPLLVSNVMSNRNMVVVGDSFTDASVTSTTGCWANYVAEALDCTLRNYAITGTGFNTGTEQTRYTGQLQKAYDDKDFDNSSVRYVFMAGCLNDMPTTNFNTLVAAVSLTVEKARELFPQAALVLMGPNTWDQFNTGVEGTSCSTLIAECAMNNVATTSGCAYVNTMFMGVGSGKYTNNNHPNDEIQRSMAACAMQCLLGSSWPFTNAYGETGLMQGKSSDNNVTPYVVLRHGMGRNMIVIIEAECNGSYSGNPVTVTLPCNLAFRTKETQIAIPTDNSGAPGCARFTMGTGYDPSTIVLSNMQANKRYRVEYEVMY